ncbi:MAG TPA: hypothetical protein VFE57_02340, partial [Cyclobacteriaceae bacterium]|nr:hypothetical protein [Cyclobacteriaceae bacterium]
SNPKDGITGFREIPRLEYLIENPKGDRLMFTPCDDTQRFLNDNDVVKIERREITREQPECALLLTLVKNQ